MTNLFADDTITLYVLQTRGILCSTTASTATTVVTQFVSQAVTTTTTSGTTTTPPNTGCASFVSYPGYHALGGIKTSITNQLDCLNFCIVQLTCIAYEYDTSPSALALCWYYTAPSNVSDLYNDNPLTQINVITRFPCSTSTKPRVVWREAWSPQAGSSIVPISSQEQHRQTQETTVERSQLHHQAVSVLNPQ